ncbi:hypothetical protein DKP78_26805, partial [Enterococcus faecium]
SAVSAYQAAQAFRDADEIDDSERWFVVALESLSSNTPDDERIAFCHSELGHLYNKTQRSGQAVAEYLRAAEMFEQL